MSHIQLNVPVKTVLNEVIRLANEFPDNVHKPHSKAVGCKYTNGNNTHTGNTGCLIGQAIVNVDPTQYYPLMFLDQNCSKGVWDLFDCNTKEEQKYKATLSSIQTEQDRGAKWSECVKGIEKV